MYATTEKNLYKPSNTFNRLKKERNNMTPGLDMLNAVIIRTTEISENIFKLHETYTVKMVDKSNDFFMSKGFVQQSLSIIEEKAKVYFGENMSVQWKLNKELGLYEVFLYNDNLTLEENYDKLDEFDTWWLSEGIEQFDDIVIYLR